MLSENFLLDSFIRTGSDVEDFENLLKEVEEHVSFVRCESAELSLLSYVPRDDDVSNGHIGFFELDPQNLASPTTMSINDYCKHVAGSYRRVLENKILAKGEFEDLIKELKNDTRLAIYIKPNDVYFTSNNIIAMMDRFDMAKGFLKKPCFERDAVIAKQFSDNHDCTLCVKSINGVKKIFSIASGKYTPLNQRILLDIIDMLSKSGGMGKPKCHLWEITHYKSSIYVEFPDKAKEISELYGFEEELIPGIWMATSDTSNCSLKIRGTWRRKNSITLFGEVGHRHIGDIDIKKIIDDVEKNIFSQYTKLPDALCDLMAIDLIDSTVDVTTGAGQDANRAAIKSTLKSIFKEINMIKAIGRKRAKSLFDGLVDEFDASINYTAYDIAISILTIPERVNNVNPLIKENLQKACGLAPYANYKNISDEESIILTA